MIPEAVEEVEAIEELEEAEAVEEPAEIQAVEDVEAVEELEALEAVEELEEAEAIEEPGAVESLEEAEEIEEAAEAEIAEQLRAMASTTPADTPMRPQQTTEKPAPATELEERIQELEAVKEMTTLPPLPQEDLEELPEAPKVAVKHPKRPKRAARATPPGEDVGRKKVPVQKAEEKLEELKEPEAAGDTAQALQRAGAAAKAPSAQRHFEILLKKGKIQSFTLAEMEQKIIENRTSVVMENGVYRVKQELYGDTQGKKRAMGLKALAESVLSAQAEEESGIGTLFGEDVLLDFDKDLGASSSGGVELLLGGRQRAKKIQFFENGLDYDSYLGGFGAGKSVTQRLKSLVELSGKLKAVNAAIFSKQDKRLRLAFKVGLLDDPGVIEFAEGEYLYNAFLSPRKTVLIRERPELIEGLGRKFNPDDLRYLQAAVLIPIIYEDRESYLYMGLPDEKYCELDHLITRLDIY
jgi:chemotaxis protein histidine kinase CheA